MLYATFGSFVPLGMLVYGLQESFAKSSGDFACKYYMMDVLKLDGATMGRSGVISDSVVWCVWISQVVSTRPRCSAGCRPLHMSLGTSNLCLECARMPCRSGDFTEHRAFRKTWGHGFLCVYPCCSMCFLGSFRFGGKGHKFVRYLVCACVFSICLYLWVGFNAVSALGLFAYLTGLNLAIAFAELWLQHAHVVGLNHGSWPSTI